MVRGDIEFLLERSTRYLKSEHSERARHPVEHETPTISK